MGERTDGETGRKRDQQATELEPPEASSKRQRTHSAHPSSSLSLIPNDNVAAPTLSQPVQDAPSHETSLSADLLGGLRDIRRRHTQGIEEGVDLDIELIVRVSDSTRMPNRGEVGLLLGGALVFDSMATARLASSSTEPSDIERRMYRLGTCAITQVLDDGTFDGIQQCPAVRLPDPQTSGRYGHSNGTTVFGVLQRECVPIPENTTNYVLITMGG
ncbi:hypothetical protein BCR39DRAFT_536966 [Naematelia encephala]|uniref:Uncharacterized protein n=1 Tax=Naematelia encephala TaxID=71784 RepID=A0A1Y2AYV7_9TREE|nr:hypothetical protein BCR39DRAFT_536966 [Naematelia encephala]